MIRVPVTFADLNSPRFKSSVSKLKAHAFLHLKISKLSAVRQAFAKALGYGGEAELRAHAKQSGDFYTGCPLQVADVIASVSQRIARQWDVPLASAETIALSLGLQHFDACRAVTRASSHQTNAAEASLFIASEAEKDKAHTPPQTEMDRSNITNLRKTEVDRLGRTHFDISPLANPLQGALDELTRANPFQGALDELTRANPLQEAIDRLALANPFQGALDELTRANPFQGALDELTRANPLQSALDELTRANPLQEAIDRLALANPFQGALDELARANPFQGALNHQDIAKLLQ